MKRLICAYSYLICTKLKHDKGWKALLIIISFAIFSIATISYILMRICACKPWVAKVILQYSIYLLLYIALTCFPVLTFNKFIVNKEYDRFFMVGISLPTCFFWIYLKEIIKIFITVGICVTILGPSLYVNDISFIYFGSKIFVLAFTMYNVQLVVLLVQYIIFGKLLYKILLFLVGCVEIFSFFLLQAILDQAYIVTISILDIPCLNLHILFLNVFLIGMELLLYQKNYFRKGFNGYKFKNVNRKNAKSKLMSKEVKLFIRDFDRMKFVIVTFLIFFFSSIIGNSSVRKAEYQNVFVLCLTMYFMIGLQLMIDCVKADRKKCEIYIMAEINWSDYIKEKTKFAFEILAIISIVYNFMIFVRYQIDYKYSVIFSIGTVFFILNLSLIYAKYLAKIILCKFCLTMKNVLYYIENILKMLGCIIILFVVTVSVIQISGHFMIKIMVISALQCVIMLGMRINKKRKIKFSEQVLRN